MKSKKIPDMSKDDLAVVKTWLAANADSVPEQICSALVIVGMLVESLEGARYKASSLLKQLRRALGITSSSEGRKSGNPLSNLPPANSKSLLDQIVEGIERSKVLAKWHRFLAKKHTGKSHDLEKKKMKLEDIQISPEEEAIIERESQEHAERLMLGDGADKKFQSVKETLMAGAAVNLEEETVRLEPEASNGKIVDEITDQRSRIDFGFSLTKINIEVTKHVIETDDGERRVISPPTHEFGPPRYGVTWDFLANVSILASQYAMPFNRLSNIVSTPLKRFTAGGISRQFAYVARRFLPIYLELADKLCDSNVINGDDTSSKVIEVETYAKLMNSDELETTVLISPWQEFATREKAEEIIKKQTSGEPSLSVLLAAEFGFESTRKDGKGPKSSLQTTVVSGRANDDDPTSLIVFYRTHIGSFGNLLSVFLEKRQPQRKKIVIQSDLASINLISQSKLDERFSITQVGCASHGRRPFALHEEEDPDPCAAMLHYFLGIFMYEDSLDKLGRNEINTLAVRKHDIEPLWYSILDLAKILDRKWSAATNLGRASRYIINHFNELTAYLYDARLGPSNNFSERMLRLEKTIQDNSFFRKSLEGRCALDIMRTILQTAIAAGVSLQEYVAYVLRAEPEHVKTNPHLYTPHFFANQSLSLGKIFNLSEEKTHTHPPPNPI